MTDDITFSFQMETAYFQNIDDTSSTLSPASTAMETLSVTNSGILSTPPIITFTPSVAFTLLQVEIASGYGFRLESSFNAGQEIIFDCQTGIVTIQGEEVTGIQTGGSSFSLPSGTSTLNIYACQGALEVSWFERFI